jgi:hypothetical protein
MEREDRMAPVWGVIDQGGRSEPPEEGEGAERLPLSRRKGSRTAARKPGDERREDDPDRRRHTTLNHIPPPE